MPEKPRYEEEERCFEHFRSELRAWIAAHPTQTAAAKALRTHQPNLSRWLNPRAAPPLWAMLRLAKATGRSLGEVLGLETAPPASLELAEIKRLLRKTHDEVTTLSTGRPPAGRRSTVRPVRPRP